MSDIRESFNNEIGTDFRGEIMYGEMLSGHTSIAVGGPADMYVLPYDAVSLKTCLMFANDRGLAVLVLGGGTNVIVDDNGYRGMVISLKHFNMIKTTDDPDERVDLFVETGVPLQRLINYCVERGYAGIEGLTGIPGTVGGAIIGNSGSFGQEIRDVVESIVVINLSGMIKRLERDEFSFGYRRSSVEQGLIILSANMRFKKSEPEVLSGKASECISRKKNTQPLSERSAGCVYMNPEGRAAGMLIEEAGCKGMRAGDIEVSRVHANYFINRGNGTASDFLKLMKMVEARVFEHSGVSLEPEVKVIAGKHE